MHLSSLRKLVSIGFVLLLFVSIPSHAVVIEVDCSAAALTTAIATANGNGQADTLNLSEDCNYVFTAGSATDAETALPHITSEITINGSGATIRRTGAPTAFRLLYVESTGNLTLDNVIVMGGYTLHGGGISNLGTLTLTDSTFSGNAASNNGGGIFNYVGGTLTVTGSTLSGNTASYGGGLYNSGTAAVVSSTLSDNDGAFGGGISNLGTLTLTDSTLSDNSVLDNGGGIYNLGALTITSSTLSENTADYGGGVYNNGGTLTATDSDFSGNSADYGGGLYVEGGVLTVTNGTLSGNSSTSGAGGAIVNDGGTVTVTNSTLAGNSANGSGGCVYNFDGTLNLLNSTLANNSATQYGGCIYNFGGLSGSPTLNATGSTISGNLAFFGGGIYNASGGTLTATNTVLSGNLASFGGGIYIADDTLTLINSTLAGNKAVNDGGGIYNTEFGTLTVTNSILWGNSTQIYNDGGAVTLTYYIEQGGFFSADPLFVAPEPFSSAPTTAGDYHIQFGSPAIDLGDNGALPTDMFDLDNDGDTGELLPYDLDGHARMIYGKVDLGAYEVGELLGNRNFEVDDNGDKVPDGWTVKKASGDKRKCNKSDKTFSFEGACAFMFKGGIGERAKLQQTVDLTGVPFNVNDTLLLSANFNGSNPAVSAKFILKAKYNDLGEPTKRNATVDPLTSYTPVTLDALTLASGDVNQIKVMVKHKSTAGKLFVDTASLILIPAAARGRSDILPPPAVPDGMRGFN